MCDDFLYHHNVLTHHFLFYHYPILGSGLNPLIYNFSFDILFSHYETIYRDKVSALWS
ncbi:MAG: hypothetical protein ACTFAK_10095 [Candidatus Electronema sp. VV]